MFFSLSCPVCFKKIKDWSSIFKVLRISYFSLFQIFKEAEKCLTCLSNRLGDKDFFFGNHPSTLDSFVFGCLAPLLKAPFSANVLQNYLKACPNLVKFINRISQRYFSRDLKGISKSLLSHFIIWRKVKILQFLWKKNGWNDT